MIAHPSGTLLVKKVDENDNFIEEVLNASDIPITTTGTNFQNAGISGTDIEWAMSDVADALNSISGGGTPVSVENDDSEIIAEVETLDFGNGLTASANGNEAELSVNESELSTFVRLTGDETISGTKTFADPTIIENITISGSYISTAAADLRITTASGQRIFLESVDDVYLWPDDNLYIRAGGVGGNQWIVNTNGSLVPGSDNAYQIGVSGTSVSSAHVTNVYATEVGTDTDTSLVFKTTNIDRWKVASPEGHLYPALSGVYNLGDDNFEIQRVYAEAYTAHSGMSFNVTNSGDGYYNWNFGSIGSASLSASGHFYPQSDASGQYIGDPSHHWERCYSNEYHSKSTLTLESAAGTSIYFQTDGTLHWYKNSDGHFIPNSNGSYDIGSSSLRVGTVYSEAFNATNSGTGIHVYAWNTNSSYASTVSRLLATRSANSAYGFLRCYSSAGGDTEFHLRGDGNAFCDGSWTGGGADYAEYIESAEVTLSIGEVVVFDELNPGMVREFDDQSDSAVDIVGVIRPKEGGAAVVGNLPLQWHKKYLRDVFGAYIVDANGDRQLNPDYDDQQSYVSRSDRAEWYVVGLVGQVVILKGQPVNFNWIKIKDVGVDHELWLIK